MMGIGILELGVVVLLVGAIISVIVIVTTKKD